MNTPNGPGNPPGYPPVPDDATVVRPRGQTPAVPPPAAAPPAYAPAQTYAQPAYPAPQQYSQPAQQASNAWYFCASANGYYPYVRQCAEGWQQVAPQPPR